MSLPKRIDELDTASQASVSLSAGAAVAVVTGGKTIQTSIGALVPAGSNIVSVKDPQFGAKGDGVTSDSAAALAATAAVSAAGGGVVTFPGPGPYLFGSTVALTSAHANVCWRLEGATIKKGFNGDLVTVTGCTNFAVDGNGTIDGVMTSFTGKGFVIFGTLSSYFYTGPGILTKAFDGAHFEYSGDGGFSSKLMSDALADPSQLTPVIVDIIGPDSSAMQRSFWGRMIGQIKITGGLSNHVFCPIINNVLIDSTSSVTSVIGSSWSNNGNPITIDGANTFVMGCRLAGAVTLNVGMSGVFVGNHQTAAGFTNNTVAGNVTILHEGHNYSHPGTAALPSKTFNGDPDTGFWSRTANVITASLGGNDQIEFQPAAFAMGAANFILWLNANTISGASAADTGLARKAAGVIEVNNGTLGTVNSLKAYPVTDADALQTACLLRAGTGAPNNANGANGDIYFRSDGGALTTVYQRRAGAWVGIT